MGMIAGLAIIYISNSYHCENQISKEVELKKELQDIKYESLTISAELTKLSRRTYILNYIKERGLALKESPYAPVIIKEPDPIANEAIKKAKDEHKVATDNVKSDTTSNEETIGE